MHKKKIKNEDVIRNTLEEAVIKAWVVMDSICKFSERKEATKQPNIMANIEHKTYGIFLAYKPLGK